MSEHQKDQKKTKVNDDTFAIYQGLRINFETLSRTQSAQQLINTAKSYSLSDNLSIGIIREIRALYYLRKWRPKWEFHFSNAIDDLTGVDITAFKTTMDENDCLDKVTFQVGGVRPDKKALSSLVDYYVQVTDNKVYIHKLV